MILDILFNFSDALKQGQSLGNTNTWLNAVHAKNALVTVFGFALIIGKQFNYDFGISDDQLIELAGAVASIGSVVGAYFHVALNKEVGRK
jgi:hypothetical protein